MYALALITPCFWFADDYLIAHVRSFDDWYLSSCLRRTTLAFHKGAFFNFAQGLFDISYGPIFWLILFIITYPFFLLNSEFGILLSARFFSLLCGLAAWVVILALLRRYVTKNPLILSCALLPGLLVPQIINFETSIHPDMLAMLASALMLYFVMRDREQKVPFSHFFSWAIVALCVAGATKINAAAIGAVLALHTLINIKSYSVALLKKHFLIAGSLTFLVHFPLLHIDILKHYVGRFIFLSSKARELGDWHLYWKTVGEKCAAFTDWFFPCWLFFIIAGIALVTLFFNRKKWWNEHASFLFGTSLFFFISHSIWVLASNHVIWVHYALIGALLLPIIIAFILQEQTGPLLRQIALKGSLSITLLLVVVSMGKKGLAFAHLDKEPDRVALYMQLKKVQAVFATVDHQFTTVAATPPLGLTPYSTIQVPDILNVRVSKHFDDLSSAEAIIMHTNFCLHDKPVTKAVDYVEQQVYSSLFSKYYSDEELTILIKQHLIQPNAT
jgi:hypothetical protein